MIPKSFTVFVYGTLKPGGHYWPRFCEGKVSNVVEARIRGRLYNLNVGYPGVVLDDSGWVQGCLLTFSDENDLEQLDWLEGYDEGRVNQHNEYVRLKVPCFTPKGEELGDHWVYEMTQKTIRQHVCTWIENGQWQV